MRASRYFMLLLHRRQTEVGPPSTEPGCSYGMFLASDLFVSEQSAAADRRSYSRGKSSQLQALSPDRHVL